MSNKSINEQLAVLRQEYSQATPERKEKIEEEAKELKKHYVKCGWCKTNFPDDDEREYGFCNDECRNAYYPKKKFAFATKPKTEDDTDNSGYMENLQEQNA